MRPSRGIPRRNDAFLTHSINHMVGKDRHGAQKAWNFTHQHDDRHGQSSLGQSQVVVRLKKDRPRLPSAMYDVAARD